MRVLEPVSMAVTSASGMPLSISPLVRATILVALDSLTQADALLQCVGAGDLRKDVTAGLHRLARVRNLQLAVADHDHGVRSHRQQIVELLKELRPSAGRGDMGGSLLPARGQSVGRADDLGFFQRQKIAEVRQPAPQSQDSHPQLLHRFSLLCVASPPGAGDPAAKNLSSSPISWD